MATKLVLKNCFVEVDGVDLTCNVRSVEVMLSKAAVEANTMCGPGNQHGLETCSFTINFAQSFDTGLVNDTFEPHWVGETAFTVTVRPVEAEPVSATNPEYTGSVKLFEYTPLTGSVGDLVETSINLPVEGLIQIVKE